MKGSCYERLDDMGTFLTELAKDEDENKWVGASYFMFNLLCVGVSLLQKMIKNGRIYLEIVVKKNCIIIPLQLSGASCTWK